MSTLHADKLYRLLVIDDNRAIHEDFRKILLPNTALAALKDMEVELFGDNVEIKHRQFFELDSAYQGKEGFEMVTSAVNSGNPYSLAFVDMRMPPGWDGIETIEHLWEVDPDLQIVICSAYSDHSWSEISQRLGNSDRLLILKKPFDNVEITQMAHAMSQKCTLNRMARNLQQNQDSESNNAVEIQQLKQCMNNLSVFIQRIDEKLLLPIQDVRDSVVLLNRSFDKLSIALNKLHNMLAQATDLEPERLVNELQSAASSNDLSQLQQQIPDVFHRLQSKLEKIYSDADDFRGLLNSSDTLH